MEILSFILNNTNAFFAIFVAIVLVKLAFFILKGVSLFKMNKDLNFKKPFLAFIPIISPFSLGRLSDAFDRANNKKSRNSSKLLTLSILKVTLLVFFVFMVLISFSTILTYAKKAAEGGTAMEPSMFYSLIPMFVLYVASLALAVIYAVYFYISLYKVYKLYIPSLSVAATVISIIISPATSIFLLVASTKQPTAPKSIEKPSEN